MQNAILDSELAHEYARLRDNSGRAQTVIYVFWGMLAINVVQLALNASLIFRFGLEESTLADSDNIAQSLLAVFFLVAFITGIVVFIQWFRRAYFNLHEAEVVVAREEGWAAGCWFIPFMNLYVPYNIMKEIWEETQYYYAKDYQPATIVGWWWAAWLASNFVSRFTSRMDSPAGSLVSELLLITAEILVIVMVTQTAKFEREFQRKFDQNQRDFAQQSIANSTPAPESGV